MGEPVLELEGQSAAHRVQAVGGVRAGAQLRLLDGELRQQVELDGVAERLVDADAVLIDGDALRQPEERGGGEAPEPQRRLEEVGGRPLHGDRPESLVEGVRERRRAPLLDFGALDAGHDARHPVAVDTGSGQRGHSDYVDAFREGQKRESYVELAGFSRRDADVIPALRLEALPREGDHPRAGSESELVLAGRIRRRHRGRRLTVRLVGRDRGHRDADQRFSPRIRDAAPERAVLRCARRGAGRPEEAERDRERGDSPRAGADRARPLVDG